MKAMGNKSLISSFIKNIIEGEAIKKNLYYGGERIHLLNKIGPNAPKYNTGCPLQRCSI